MAITLPDLPYDYDALHPVISAATLKLHHGAHHRGYVDKLNALVKGTDLERRFAGIDRQAQRRARSSTTRRRPGTTPSTGARSGRRFRMARPQGALAARIDADFGGQQRFCELFKAAAMGVFGSGWVWLVEHGGTLQIKHDGERRHADRARPAAAARARRLGARLLPGLSVPAPRLRRRRGGSCCSTGNSPSAISPGRRRSLPDLTRPPMKRRPVRLKRVYDQPSIADGTRVLVDRLWPRGLSRQDVAADLWLREAAPSAPLRRWFGHDARRWHQFSANTATSSSGSPKSSSCSTTCAAARRSRLIFGARDPDHNNAVVLREILEKEPLPCRAPAKKSSPSPSAPGRARKPKPSPCR